MHLPTLLLAHRRSLAMHVLALALLALLCIWVLAPLLSTLDWIRVQSALRDISPLQWLFSGLATTLSFAAVARYDVIVHRLLATGVGDRAAQFSGATAVALTQMLGFGVLTGTISRWRAVPSLSVAQAGSVTLLVSLSFIGIWLGLFGLAGILVPTALALPQLAFSACLFSFVCLVVFTVLRRHVTILGKRLRLPSLRALQALALFAALDTALAAAAFWILMPKGIMVGYADIVVIYLACLGASLLSHSPGGLGAFELTLLWSLQTQDINDVAAGLLAFRLVYFAAPACVAALFLLRRRPAPSTVTAPADTTLHQALQHMHPESGVIRQGGLLLSDTDGKPLAAIGQTTQALVCLFDPAAAFSRVHPGFAALCDQHAKGMLYYKLAARNALQARKAGFTVIRIARDAVIDLRELDLQIPARRSLRRKLRQAAASGLRIAEFRPTPDNIEQAGQIDAIWQDRHGTARGFSMGRFSPDYIAQQTGFGAWRGDTLVAFITCHTASDGWALDIMRHSPDASDGIMHALVWQAMNRARAGGASYFSLASAPCRAALSMRWLYHLGVRRALTPDGLSQFKRCFAPRWTPLYAAAPTRFQLWLTLWDVWQEVHDPLPLTTHGDDQPTQRSNPHYDYDHYEFASGQQPVAGRRKIAGYQYDTGPIAHPDIAQCAKPTSGRT